MTRKVLWTALLCAGLAAGCGDKGDAMTESGSMPEDDDGEGTTTSPGGTSNDDQGSGDQGSGDQGSESGDGDTGCTFLCTIDGGPDTNECDIFSQDCPEGQKCMPFTNDGTTWNATRCSDIDENPGQPGDDCTVEGGAASGVDSCDIAVMCWNVDPETGTGTCTAMCTGAAEAPICEDPGTTCSIANDGAIVLCLDTCDPILQDCPDGEACYPGADEAFVCGPDASGDMGVYGDPCEYINVCDPGLICVIPEAVPGCAGAGCCTEICDLSDPAGAAQCQGEAGGQVCEPAFAEPIPGYEDVGYCAIPA
jgi:hypothetical protein